MRGFFFVSINSKLKKYNFFLAYMKKKQYFCSRFNLEYYVR